MSLVFSMVFVTNTNICCSQRDAGACIYVNIMLPIQKIFLQCGLCLISYYKISCLLECLSLAGEASWAAAQGAKMSLE